MRTEFNTWLGSRSKMTLSPIIFYPSSSDLFLENYIVKIAMCAGITTYNALRNSGARAEDVVAILGIGGLGHLGIQYYSYRTIKRQGRRISKEARRKAIH